MNFLSISSRVQWPTWLVLRWGLQSGAYLQDRGPSNRPGSWLCESQRLPVQRTVRNRKWSTIVSIFSLPYSNIWTHGRKSLDKTTVYLCQGFTKTSGWRAGVFCSYSSSVMDWHFFCVNSRALILRVTLFLATFLQRCLILAVRATPGTYLGPSFTGAAWSQTERGLCLSFYSWWDNL